MEESIDERILWDNLEIIEKSIETKKEYRRINIERYDKELDILISKQYSIYKKILKLKR